jgi:hypothetical protein
MGMNEVFNKVSAHLLEQGFKSIDDNENCMYKTESGYSCAVGCLIDNEHYSTKFEKELVSHPKVVTALLLSGIEIDEEMIDLLSNLQACHDDFSADRWEYVLTHIADQFSIVPN